MNLHMDFSLSTSPLGFLITTVLVIHSVFPSIRIFFFKAVSRKLTHALICITLSYKALSKFNAFQKRRKMLGNEYLVDI